MRRREESHGRKRESAENVESVESVGSVENVGSVGSVGSAESNGIIDRKDPNRNQRIDSRLYRFIQAGWGLFKILPPPPRPALRHHLLGLAVVVLRQWKNCQLFLYPLL